MTRVQSREASLRGAKLESAAVSSYRVGSVSRYRAAVGEVATVGDGSATGRRATTRVPLPLEWTSRLAPICRSRVLAYPGFPHQEYPSRPSQKLLFRRYTFASILDFYVNMMGLALHLTLATLNGFDRSDYF